MAKVSASRKKLYLARLKRSVCRKKGRKNSVKCAHVKGCKTASGTKRRFCRKKHNTRRA